MEPDVAELLKLLVARGWTQSALAEKLSTTQQTVSRWATGASRPDRPNDVLAELWALADTPQLASAAPRPRERPSGEHGAGEIAHPRVFDELQKLWAAHGLPKRVAVISGAAGIGKTRLLGRLVTYASERGGLVLEGDCYREAGPYAPVAAPLRQLQGLDKADLVAAAGGLSQLERYLPGMLPASGDSFWTLADEPARSRRRDSTLLMGSEPPESRYRVLAGLVSLAAERAENGRPMLLVVDNIEVADEPTLKLIQHVINTVEQRLLVVLAYRDDVPLSDALSGLLSELKSKHSACSASFALEELANGAATTVAAEALGPDLGPTRDLARQIFERTSGNPLHLNRAVAFLRREGRIRAEPGKAASADLASLPEGIHSVIRGMFSNLPPDALYVLSLAAVADPLCSTSLFEQLAADERNPDRITGGLAELELQRLLVRRPEDAQLIEFDHVLTRETALALISPAILPRRHFQIGEALKASRPSRAIRRGCARHFIAAAAVGGLAEGIPSSIEAAQEAMDVLAYEEAIEVLTRASDALELDDRIADKWMGDILIGLAEAYLGVGDLRRCRQSALLAFERANEATTRATATLILADWGIEMGNPERSVALQCDRALAQVEGELPDDVKLRARLMAAKARNIAWSQGLRKDALELASTSVELAEAAGDVESMAYCHLILAGVLQGSADIETQREHGLKALKLAEASDNARLLAQAHGFLLRVGLQGAGAKKPDVPPLEIVRRHHEPLGRIGETTSFWYGRATDSMYGAVLAGMRGNWRDMESLSEAMRDAVRGDDNYANVYAGQRLFRLRDQGLLSKVAGDLLETFAARPGLVILSVGACLVRYELGDLDGARSHFEQLAAKDFRDVPGDATEAGCLALLAESCARLGDVERADVLLRRLQDHEHQLILVATTAACLGSADRFIGMLLACLGRHGEADKHFLHAEMVEGRLSAEPSLARTKVWRARALLDADRIGNREQATALLRRARALAEGRGMRAVLREIFALAPLVDPFRTGTADG